MTWRAKLRRQTPGAGRLRIRVVSARGRGDESRGHVACCAPRRKHRGCRSRSTAACRRTASWSTATPATTWSCSRCPGCAALENAILHKSLFGESRYDSASKLQLAENENCREIDSLLRSPQKLRPISEVLRLGSPSVTVKAGKSQRDLPAWVLATSGYSRSAAAEVRPCRSAHAQTLVADHLPELTLGCRCGGRWWPTRTRSCASGAKPTLRRTYSRCDPLIKCNP